MLIFLQLKPPEVVSQTADQSQKNEPEMKWKVRPGYKEPSFFEVYTHEPLLQILTLLQTNIIPKRHHIYNTAPYVATNLPPIKEFRHLPPPVKAKAQKFIAGILMSVHAW